MGSIYLEGYNVHSLTNYGHLYLVYVDDAGSTYVCRGGPSITDPYPFGGIIYTEAGIPLNDSKDAYGTSDTSASRGRTELYTGSDAATIWAIMVEHTNQIQQLNINYNLFSQNSNSVVVSSLHVVGLGLPFELPGDYEYPAISNLLGADQGDGESVNYVITGSSADEQMFGLEGNDKIDLKKGSDNGFGYGGKDTLQAASTGTGDDTLVGGFGDDSLSGGSKNDFLVGTIGRAFAAGVPQLIVPIAFDHFNNAARVKRLGCGVVMNRFAFGAGRGAAALGRLIASPAAAAACRRTAGLCEGADGVADACDEIEAEFAALQARRRRKAAAVAAA